MSTASTSDRQPLLHPSWLIHLESEFQQPYMLKLREFLLAEISDKKVIFPRGSEYFAALDNTPFENTKVVILGQDPYHGPGQAHGLSFSVQEGVQLPPSLLNIFKELKSDLNIPVSRKGLLLSWAKQGVLLLNSVLTVEAGQAASHQGRGWELFTDQIIRKIAENKTHVAFVLWGSYAQKKGAFIDRSKHLVIESPHPSPLSAHRGFFGSRPFSRINQYLLDHGQNPIDWAIQ